MAYKSRNEEIDESLCSTFESRGFEGEQANALELEESLLCEPIDVFILTYSLSKAKFELPKYG